MNYQPHNIRLCVADLNHPVCRRVIFCLRSRAEEYCTACVCAHVCVCSISVRRVAGRRAVNSGHTVGNCLSTCGATCKTRQTATTTDKSPSMNGSAVTSLHFHVVRYRRPTVHLFVVLLPVVRLYRRP